uniref:Uncharacterized protein n=1 Tax=Chromera velia CCMP2878 TaxID=1169474 RepID=A0A0G4GL01_9ALVE|eukprot:Cvel_22384.t1-p1 / transcript=Cvel_22384.t1 / gene=Cvel_22384 / organism=Chromera_velia_CCMP2878 / gene_product=hypothetical protein / transcript_product=hypothetical protein / location=Cvel_scaffold2194:18252-22261(+) / protein_length=436 / sequence_SO=supercontig / SO=protein_coding / is_pseudo=false
MDSRGAEGEGKRGQGSGGPTRGQHQQNQQQNPHEPTPALGRGRGKGGGGSGGEGEPPRPVQINAGRGATFALRQAANSAAKAPPPWQTVPQGPPPTQQSEAQRHIQHTQPTHRGPTGGFGGGRFGMGDGSGVALGTKGFNSSQAVSPPQQGRAPGLAAGAGSGPGAAAIVVDNDEQPSSSSGTDREAELKAMKERIKQDLNVKGKAPKKPPPKAKSPASGKGGASYGPKSYARRDSSSSIRSAPTASLRQSFNLEQAVPNTGAPPGMGTAARHTGLRPPPPPQPAPPCGLPAAPPSIPSGPIPSQPLEVNTRPLALLPEPTQRPTSPLIHPTNSSTGGQPGTANFPKATPPQPNWEGGGPKQQQTAAKQGAPTGKQPGKAASPAGPKAQQVAKATGRLRPPPDLQAFEEANKAPPTDVPQGVPEKALDIVLGTVSR